MYYCVNEQHVMINSIVMSTLLESSNEFNIFTHSSHLGPEMSDAKGSEIVFSAGSIGVECHKVP